MEWTTMLLQILSKRALTGNHSEDLFTSFMLYFTDFNKPKMASAGYNISLCYYKTVT